jgi:hypothetical protein
VEISLLEDVQIVFLRYSGSDKSLSLAGILSEPDPAEMITKTFIRSLRR